jgi:hypothetical protein
MKTQTDSVRALARAAAVPDLDALRDELAQVYSQVGNIRSRQQGAISTRLCRWDGQSDDYRKHEKDIGSAAMPYEGAPDVRVPVVDTVVRERVALYVEALMSGEIQAVPIGGLDQGENATKMSRVLKWLRDNRMQRELRREAELLANYVEGDDPGLGILKVWWKRELALELRELSLDDVALELLRVGGFEPDEKGQLPAEAQGAMMDIADLIYNPMRIEEALELMAAAFPSVGKKTLKRAFKDLQRTQQTTLPLPYVKANRPCVASLRFMQDVFFPQDLDDIQRARVIYEREFLSEAELRGKIVGEGWDESFVEEVLEAGPGPSQFDPTTVRFVTSPRGYTRAAQDEQNNLYEIWHANARATDDFGINGIYWTVFSAKVADSWGYHQLLDTAQGDYPYVDFRSEVISRGMENARGTPERTGSFQYEIKVQRDCRGAHTQLSTIPPVRVTQRRGGLEAVLGPMVEVPVRQADDVTWMNPPPFPAASIEMEKAAWLDLNQYLGRMVPGVPSELGQAVLQHDVNRWLEGWKTAWNMIQELQQDYGDELEVQIVAGGPMKKLSREEIRGQFTTTLAFSVRDLNIEFVLTRNQAIAAVLQQDITGQVDRTVIVRAGLRAIDPAIADQAIRDGQQVTMQEVNDEVNAVNMLANGIEAPLRKSGVNAQLRLDTLTKTVLGSPVLARRYQQPQKPEDEYFKKLVENRMKNLQMMIQQYGPGPDNNQAIGRTGTAPLQPAIAGGGE